jgi:hypothetical protein
VKEQRTRDFIKRTKPGTRERTKYRERMNEEEG